jgi:polysaccharide export outer membrane protein
MRLFLYIFTIIASTSCATKNILMEVPEQRKNAVKDLNSAFSYNPDYQYKIRKNDKISISVWGQDELSVGSIYGVYNSNEIYGKWLMVDAKGNIEIPKIGSKNVLGYTTIQLKDTLQSHLSKWLVNPIIDVKVLNKEITVLGEVKAPQTLVLDKEINTLFEIISKTGGFEYYADLKLIKIIRQVNDETIISNINLTQSGDYLSKNIYLNPGDVVIVNSKWHKDFDKRITTIVPFTATISAFAILYNLLSK